MVEKFDMKAASDELANLYSEIDRLTDEHASAVKAESYARMETTRVLNMINDAQKAIDRINEQIRASVRVGDWAQKPKPRSVS